MVWGLCKVTVKLLSAFLQFLFLAFFKNKCMCRVKLCTHITLLSADHCPVFIHSVLYLVPLLLLTPAAPQAPEFIWFCLIMGWVRSGYRPSISTGQVWCRGLCVCRAGPIVRNDGISCDHFNRSHKDSCSSSSLGLGFPWEASGSSLADS